MAVIEPRAELEASLKRLTDAASDYAAAKLDDWIRQVKGQAQPSGPLDRAGVAAAEAVANKGNPVGAALRGAWTGAGAGQKAMIVALLPLLVLLAPVVALLVILGVLIAAAVLRRRARPVGG